MGQEGLHVADTAGPWWDKWVLKMLKSEHLSQTDVPREQHNSEFAESCQIKESQKTNRKSLF